VVFLVGAAGCSSSPKGGLQPIDAATVDGQVSNLPDFAVADAPTLGAFDLGQDPGGPVIEVQSPMMGAEVHYDTLTVTARITSPSGTAISAESVKVIIPSTGPDGSQSAPLTLTPMPNIYTGSIDISGIRSGDSEFSVVAEDVGGKKGSARVTYVHDHGPVITFIRPTKPTAKGSITMEITVDDTLHPLADGSTVKAGIRSNNDITLTVVAGAVPLRLSGIIDFSTYNPPLDGGQLIRVEAANSAGTIGRASKQFTVDNVGPVITFTKPQPGNVIGGVVEIEATLDDLSGVNEMTVVAVFGGNVSKWAAPLNPVTPGGKDFVGFFDVRQLGRNFVFPTLSIRADDTLGNHSELAEEIVVDNTPPILSLNPPLMRVAKVKNGSSICSQEFDPVGSESANDGDKVKQIVSLKARVEDNANSAPGLLVGIEAGLDPASVTLVAVPAANAPLAVDTDGDKICDDVNPLLVPTTNVLSSNEAVALQMVVLTATGAPDFTTAGAVPPEYAAFCDAIGDTTTVPPLLCTHSGTRMTYVLQTLADGPAIWSIPPVTSDSWGCIGLQFDSLNRLPEGPTCIVVRARDKVGNTNVSAPMRVCIERTPGMCDSWQPSAFPDCTGTYDKKTNTVSATKCTPEVFSANQVRFIE
jgi:hypothetical protein